MGSFFPTLLEPRRRIDRALLAVIQEAYVQGVSTRKVDALMEALGGGHLSKSQVSRICADPAQHLDSVIAATVRTLERHPNFLRLLIALATQPPAGDNGEIDAVISGIREHALALLRAQIALAFGDDPAGRPTDGLARLALAAIDGAFVASQTDRGVTLKQVLLPLGPALVAARRAVLSVPAR